MDDMVAHARPPKRGIPEHVQVRIAGRAAMSVADAADILGYSRQFVHRLIETGALEALAHGRAKRVTTESLVRFITQS